MAVEESESPKLSTLDIPRVNNVSDSDSANPEKPAVGSMTDEQYPHGLTLVILAGASIVAVFLISLDQVSPKPTHVNTEKQTSDEKGV